MASQTATDGNYEIFEQSERWIEAGRKFRNETRHVSSPKRQKWIIKCHQCKRKIRRKEVLRESIMYCLGRIWHREHFYCVRCECLIGIDGRAFRKCSWNRNLPICLDCHMEENHPKCSTCGKTLRETCVKALGKLWHHSCFLCTKCRSPFEGRQYYLLAGKPYDIDCYHLLKYENHLIRKIDEQTQQEQKPFLDEAPNNAAKVEVTEEMTKEMKRILDQLESKEASDERMPTSNDEKNKDKKYETAKIEDKSGNNAQNSSISTPEETSRSETHSISSISSDSEIPTPITSPILPHATLLSQPSKPAKKETKTLIPVTKGEESIKVVQNETTSTSLNELSTSSDAESSSSR